jgi:predicted MFS family arabinose efflux permease
MYCVFTVGVINAEEAPVSGLFVGTMVRLGTAIIQTTPDEFRGRVSAFQQLLFRSGQPLGALLAGIAGKRLGIRMSFSAFGFILVACMVGFLFRQHLASRATNSNR